MRNGQIVRSRISGDLGAWKARHTDYAVPMNEVRIGDRTAMLKDSEIEAVSRDEHVAFVQRMTRKGRTFLNTAFGRKAVESYDDRTGNAVTYDDHGNRQTFLVCVESIEIA